MKLNLQLMLTVNVAKVKEKSPCETEALNRPTVHPQEDTSVNMEQQWNDTDSGKPNNSKHNSCWCHFVHHKSHMDCPGHTPGQPW
jgi:hypothetical protein